MAVEVKEVGKIAEVSQTEVKMVRGVKVVAEVVADLGEIIDSNNKGIKWRCVSFARDLISQSYVGPSQQWQRGRQLSGGVEGVSSA